MGKSRKHKGGKILGPDCAKNPDVCPRQTEHGSSLMSITSAGINQTNDQNANQSASIAALSGGGKRKKGGADKVVCPQPAAGSGGSIPAGGSSAGANMCDGLGTSQQQSANAVGDSTKGLSTSPPKNPFVGGKSRRRKTRRRRRKSRRKPRRKSKRKSRRKSKRRRKTKKRSRKSRRRHY